MEKILFLTFTALVHTVGMTALCSIIVKASWKKNILFFFGLFFLNTLNAIFFPQIIFMSPLVFLILIPGLVILIFRLSILRGVLIYSLMLSNLLMMQSVNMGTWNAVVDKVNMNDKIQITILIVMTMVECLLLKKLNVLFFRNILEPVKEGNLIMSLVRFVPSFFVIFIVLISVIFHGVSSAYVLFSIASSLCVLFFLVVYYYETKVIFANRNTEVKRKQLEDFSLMAGAVVAQKHEQHNHMQSILLLIESESDIQTLREETRGYIERFSGHNERKVKIFGATGRRLLESLLYFKKLQAESLGIDFQMFLNEPILGHAITDYDLNEILGCLIDNAFEASPKGAVYLFIEGGNEAHVDRICVKNQHPPLSVEFIYRMMEKGVTTKQGHIGVRGYGLYNLKNLLHKHKWQYSIYNERINGENFVVFCVVLDRK